MEKSTTLLFNEWITIVALQEEALLNLGHEVFRKFTEGQGDEYDPSSLELCRQIGELQARARDHRAELREEVGDTAAAPDARLTQKARSAVKSGLASWYINRNLEGYKSQVVENKITLGRRAVSAVEAGRPLLPDERHKGLCRYAARVGRDADRKWLEIQVAYKSGKGRGGSPFFLTILMQVFRLAGKTGLRPWLYKLLKYDEEAEKVKLRKAYSERDSIVIDSSKVQKVDPG